VTNKLVFGKPNRILRLPIENILLENSYFDKKLQARYLSREFDYVISLFRALIDKPNKIKPFIINYSKKNKLYGANSNKEIEKVINELEVLMDKYKKEGMKIQHLRKSSIKKVKRIKGNEMRVRSLQKYFLKIVRGFVKGGKKIGRIPNKVNQIFNKI